MATVMSEEGDLPTESHGEPRVRILTDWSIERLMARLDCWFETFRAHMAPITDQNPPPDFEKDQRDLRDLLAAAVEAGARQAHIHIRSQHSEGGDRGPPGDKSWQEKLIFPLVVAGVIGAIGTFAQVLVLHTKLDEHIRMEDQQRQEQRQDADRRFDRLERKVFP